MRAAFFFKPPISRITWVVYAAITLTLISVVSNFYGKPRTWPVAEVPIAFWAWRTQSPSQAELREAIEKTRASKLFLRAGQIDYQDGKLRRIRPLSGSLPQAIELHLVYNATRSLLTQFENVDQQSLATAIYLAYQEDLERAKHDHANVRGLQLDIDVPTRLLPRYEKTLSALRKSLPQGTQLSITGLPTWMESSELDHVLKQVHFWVPQFYGAQIPQRSDQIIPISSPQSITHFVKRARELDQPFYAGLSAYSIALLYSPSGALISLRGDMDPASIASDPNLEPIDRRSFNVQPTNSPISEWRYSFRAKADGVTDGLAMQGGDVLVVDVPNSESLRTAARIVREQAGEKLLGICIFRLPARDDPATLSAEQVNSALKDQDASALIDVRIRREPPGPNAQTDSHNYAIELKNVGTASALLGSLQIDLSLSRGSFVSITSKTNISLETVCTDAGSLQPCSQRRANLIRLTPKTLAAGQTLKAIVVLNHESPPTIPVSVTMLTDTGESYAVHRDVSVETGVSQ
jgi:hypothetical protein